VAMKVLNATETYSPPLSVCSCLMEEENKFSTRFLNLTKHGRTSDLFLNGYNHVNR
jgi:hypothetical protein